MFGSKFERGEEGKGRGGEDEFGGFLSPPNWGFLEG